MDSADMTAIILALINLVNITISAVNHCKLKLLSKSMTHVEAVVDAS